MVGAVARLKLKTKAIEVNKVEMWTKVRLPRPQPSMKVQIGVEEEVADIVEVEVDRGVGGCTDARVRGQQLAAHTRGKAWCRRSLESEV